MTDGETRETILHFFDAMRKICVCHDSCWTCIAYPFCFYPQSTEEEIPLADLCRNADVILRYAKNLKEDEA